MSGEERGRRELLRRMGSRESEDDRQLRSHPSSGWKIAGGRKQMAQAEGRGGQTGNDAARSASSAPPILTTSTSNPTITVSPLSLSPIPTPLPSTTVETENGTHLCAS